MKNLLLLFVIPLLLISCVRDNDEDNKIGETVSLNLELDLNLSLKKSDETNKGVGLTNKFSEFAHIFKDEVDFEEGMVDTLIVRELKSKLKKIGTKFNIELSAY